MFLIFRLKPFVQTVSERSNTNIAGSYKTRLCCCCHLPQQQEHYECIKTVAFVIEKSIPNLLQWSSQPLCLSLCVSVWAAPEGHSSSQSLIWTQRGIWKAKTPACPRLTLWSIITACAKVQRGCDRQNRKTKRHFVFYCDLCGVRRWGHTDRLMSYLHHCYHAIVANRVGADGEVPGWVSADDPVDGVPVWRVWLVGVYHCKIGNHNIHSVLRDLTWKLQEAG